MNDAWLFFLIGVALVAGAWLLRELLHRVQALEWRNRHLEEVVQHLAETQLRIHLEHKRTEEQAGSYVDDAVPPATPQDFNTTTLEKTW